MFHGAPNDRRHFIGVDRLGKVVVGSRFHRLHGCVDGSEGGEHDDEGLRVLRAGLLEQFESGHSRHAEIGNDEVEGPELQEGQSLLRGGRDGDFIAVLLQLSLQNPAQTGVVVDYENLAFRHIWPG